MLGERAETSMTDPPRPTVPRALIDTRRPLSIERHAGTAAQDGWPSGRRRSPAKRVWALKAHRGFESLPIRHRASHRQSATIAGNVGLGILGMLSQKQCPQIKARPPSSRRRIRAARPGTGEAMGTSSQEMPWCLRAQDTRSRVANLRRSKASQSMSHAGMRIVAGRSWDSG